jgi:antitoxin component YwqK of YwqJK toxin-antitoxin module
MNIYFKISLNLFFFLIVSNIALAQNQEIKTININGNTYFVYPTKKEIDEHVSYTALKRENKNKFNYEDYKSDYTKKEFKRLVKQKCREGKISSFYGFSERQRMKKLKTLMGKNPFPFLEPNYTLDYDMIPPLDSIPDGAYVQLYEDFYRTNRFMKESKTPEVRIAAYFTIKNNVIEGPAFWLNLEGDTLKKGNFKKGVKEGEWILEQRDLPYSFYYGEIAYFKKFGYPEVDTTMEIWNYQEGQKNGLYVKYNRSQYPVEEGFYNNNERTGQWKERDVRVTGWGIKKKRIRNNELVTFSYTIADEESIVKQPIIRYTDLTLPSYDEYYNFNSKFDIKLDFYNFFDFAVEGEDNALELEEEAVNSYDDRAYYSEGYYDDYSYENSDFRNTVYDYSSGKYIPLSKYIDSLGISFIYDGICEKYYPNGQLNFRFEFKNGQLLKEDTIFWDNGQAFDVINFENDSNQYVRNIYDYNGTLFKSAVYDSAGTFKKMRFNPNLIVKTIIEGYEVENDSYSDYYFYDNRDSIFSSALDENQLSFKSWHIFDTSAAFEEYYNPAPRILTLNSISITGNRYEKFDVQFGEKFENWNGTNVFKFGPFELQTTISASLISYNTEEGKDSVTEIKEFERIKHFDESFYFEMNEDPVLYYNGQPYSGKMNLKFATPFYSIANGKEITMKMPNDRKSERMTNRMSRKHAQNKAFPYPELANILNRSELNNGVLNNLILTELFEDFTSYFVEYPSEYNYYQSRGSNKSGLKGNFVNGKPEGIWTAYDESGQISATIPFHNGTIDGTVTTFASQYPNKWSLELYETYPKKKTRYVSSTQEFKNGMLNGASATFYWDGQIATYTEYKDGYEHGKAFERNNLAHSTWNNSEGELDGYVRTYLTLQGKDSMLLYSLNFQDGLLQGESKSYHTTGKLAKRGFFLNGEPIEDYEAFDTLGFKYHYVKFLYGYPTEEKIWEENKLSVRYLFDWRDSIYFVPTDITETQSLDRVLSDLGLLSYYPEYHGRPSLVDKEGISYHVTKYYPNDQIARDGTINEGKKTDCWQYYNYDGEFLYEVDYFDSIIQLNDSIRFKSKGVLTDYNSKGQKISQSYVIEKFEKYDCSHTDHYEVRQLYTFWQENDTVDRLNGYVKNYYDNGVLQNEGKMKGGLPTGVWKFYDPYGKLNLVGSYTLGKRDGRWLSGDLSKSKYIGDICLDPNLPNLEEEISRREKELEINIINYVLGKSVSYESYDWDLNEQNPLLEEDTYGRGYYYPDAF